MKNKIISPFNLLLVWITFISLFCPEMPAQVIRCFYCKMQITGSYITVEGYHYHPEHFLCKKCGKPIEGSYQKLFDDFYHPGCYEEETAIKCAVCDQVINGESITKDFKFYHPECYRKFILPKCSICLEPLDGEYQIDVYGNKFHPMHSVALDKCEACGRIICSQLTNGGRYYQDGRHICNLCYDKAVFNQNDINVLFVKVMNKLIEMGINLNKNNISINIVDKNELKRISGMEIFSQLEGFCNSESMTEYLNKIKKKTLFNHKVYVLSGLPAVNLEAVIAHELMHAWTAENTLNNQPLNVKEGSCNFIAYQYLFYSTDSEVKYLLMNMDKNPDPIYGVGFLKIKNKFYGKPVSALLDYLKTFN